MIFELAILKGSNSLPTPRARQALTVSIRTFWHYVNKNGIICQQKAPAEHLLSVLWW